MTASTAAEIGTHGDTPAEMFVINLAASTSPMALAHPTEPELKRYTFFVSRQRQDGRERFRLHMGYFSSQEEADALLANIRDIYPAAWAGPAPSTGAKRRTRSAPGAMVQTSSAPVMPAAIEMPAAVPVVEAVRTATAAPAAAPALTSPVAAVAAAAEDIARLDTMSNVRDVLAELSETPVARAPATAVAKPVVAATDPTMLAPALAVVASKPAAASELSGVDALRLLEDSGTRAMPAALVAELAGQAPMAASKPAPKPVVAAQPVAATKPMAAAPTPVAAPSLPPLKNPFEGLENEPEVRLVTPEDTQTLTDIKLDQQNNAPPCFAVQLIWSPSMIDVASLPHLAIFDAYTLYNVEGNRQGRKWYGLRLGFFTDPNSATQVANYVRSDYRNVAVVPVAVKERDHARGGAPQVATGVQKTTDDDFRREKMDGFELLTDDRPVAPRRDIEDTARAKAPVPPTAKPVATRAPMKPATAVKVAPAAPAAAGPAAPKAATGKRVVARRRPPPLPSDRVVSSGVGGAEVLESTLEILGASTLSLEDGGRELITDAAARKSNKAARGRFSKLLSRLSGG